MLEVTETAASNLKSYFTENKIESPVRVALMSGCGGSALGLALDEPGADDKVFEDHDLKFVIAQDLLDQCGSVKIDFIDAGYQSGFAVSSENPVGESGGGCGGCTGCGH